MVILETDGEHEHREVYRPRDNDMRHKHFVFDIGNRGTHFHPQTNGKHIIFSQAIHYDIEVWTGCPTQIVHPSFLYYQ